jgi:hypothetical protein
MNIPQNCRFLARRFLGKEICELLNERTFGLFLDFFYEFCGGYLPSNVWVVVVRFLLHDFDYDAVAFRYGLSLTRIPEPRIPEPIFVPVIEYFDNRAYMAFMVYNKNPGVDKLYDSMTVFLPTNKSVKTIVIIVKDIEFVCGNIGDIRNAITAWMCQLFNSTSIDKILM